jgi:hypothetical protein
MITLRQEQIDAMAEAEVRSFRERLVRHLENVLPDKGIQPRRRQLEYHVEEGLKRLSLYDLHNEFHVAMFVEIVCSYLGGFRPQPLPVEASNILCDRRYGPVERLTQFETWAKANSRTFTWNSEAQ